MDLDNICRVCLKTGNDMVELTRIIENETVSFLKVLNCISESKCAEDRFSKLICKPCGEDAKLAYHFKLKYEESKRCISTYLQLKMEVIQSEKTCSEEPVSKERKTRTRRNVKNINYAESKMECIEGATIKEEFEENMEDHGVDDFEEELEVENNSPENVELLDVFTCSLCNKALKSKYILKVHEMRHKFKGQFVCHVCGKGFSSQGCLSRHNRVHTGEKKYVCEICNKRFPTSNNLNMHSRTHTGLKPYLCTVCGKSFSQKTGLTYHMLTHNKKERAYNCEICGKLFSILGHYKRHKKIHTGEKPFSCSTCGRAFTQKFDLQRHEETHSGQKPHKCNVCEKSFLRKLHLKLHLMTHTDEKPHLCRMCGKGFIRTFYLRDHMKKHHKEEMELELKT